MKKVVSRIAAVLFAVLLLVGAMPATNYADETGEITLVPNDEKIVGMGYGGNYNVFINGDESQPRIVYCLQQGYHWPGKTVKYSVHSNKLPDDYHDKDLLDDNQLASIKKILYAGYPNNAIGIFDDLYQSFDESTADSLAADITQLAIWYMMAFWEKPGHGAVDLEDQPQVAALVNFARGDKSIEPPSSNEIHISGSGKMKVDSEGKWSTGALVIKEPVGYGLTYNFTANGVKVVDENGNELTDLKEGKSFYLTADNKDDLSDASGIEISTTVHYPTDVTFYVTKDYIENSVKPGEKFNDYQTMLCTAVSSKKLDGSLKVTAVDDESGDDDQIDDDDQNDDGDKDNDGGNEGDDTTIDTGDYAPIAAMSFMFFASAVAIIFMVVYRRRRAK